MKFLEHIDSEWIAKKTLELVNIGSETMQEERICDFYANELEELGLQVVRRIVKGSRYNIYAKLSGSASVKSLAFNGHLDTVPIGEAWPPKIQGDRVYGRGAEDMKGGLASLLALIRALKLSGTQLAGDLWVTAVVGHEDSEAVKDGPNAMCDDIISGIITCDAIVIAEGDSELWTMSTGSAVFKINLLSKLNGSHTNNVPFHNNPIRFLGKVIEAVDLLQEKMNVGERHYLVGPPRIDLGRVTSGDYYNRTPAVSTLEGIVRWLPGSTLDTTKKMLNNLVAPIAKDGDLDFNIEFTLEREPFEISRDNEVLDLAFRAIERISGSAPQIIGKRIVGDANIFVARANVPSFYYGPGYQTAHSNTEWVSVGQLVENSKILGCLAIDYLGLSE